MKLAVMVLAVAIAVSPLTAGAFSLPDSDQRKCFQGVDPYGVICCEGTGQDGAYVINPLSYTDNGDGTVTDNNTDLIWQQGENLGAYNWYQASGTYDATYNPGSESVCGSLALGGWYDWRLPSKKELMGIIDYAVLYPGPTIGVDFPGARNSYWSSTMLAGTPGSAWVAWYDYGGVTVDTQDLAHAVRCVRGGQSPPLVRFTANSNGTVTDAWTGLVWQQATESGGDWASATSYCENLPLGGFDDWRLPNVKEMESLVDDTRVNPAIDTGFFPGTQVADYWSSTTYPGNPNFAWNVDLGNGHIDNDGKPATIMWMRCVRGGRSPVLDPIGGRTVDEGQRLFFTVAGSDPDDAALTFFASDLPPGARLDATTATFTWTPGLNQAGVYTGIQFTVSDGMLTDTEAVTITVRETFSIRGRVRTSLGAPLRRAIIRLTPDGGLPVIAITNSLGRYSFSGLLSETGYTIRPAKAGWAFTPASRVALIENASVVKQDFTATPQ